MNPKTAPPERPHNVFPIDSLTRATDYVFCTADNLSVTLDKINRQHYQVIAVTQWREVYTIFFRTLVAYG